MKNEWIRIDDSTWRYDDGHVRFFLLTGTDRALLIDSGVEVRNAKELAQQLTTLPIELFNTHADRDHIASNDEFDHFYINPAELVNFKQPVASDRVVPVYDGDVIDLGGRPLTAVALPGHTPGSTALLDQNSGMFFSGDPIQDGSIFMFGPMRSMAAYIHSLRRVSAMKDRISAIYPAHGTCPVSPDIVDKLIEGALRVERGDCAYTVTSIFGNTVREYDIGCAVLRCNDQ